MKALDLSHFFKLLTTKYFINIGRRNTKSDPFALMQPQGNYVGV